MILNLLGVQVITNREQERRLEPPKIQPTWFRLAGRKYAVWHYGGTMSACHNRILTGNNYYRRRVVERRRYAGSPRCTQCTLFCLKNRVAIDDPMARIFRWWR